MRCRSPPPTLGPLTPWDGTTMCYRMWDCCQSYSKMCFGVWMLLLLILLQL